HRVDPLAVSGGPVHEVPQGVEQLPRLECGLLGSDDHGEVPCVRPHRMGSNCYPAPEAPRFPCPAAVTPRSAAKSKGAEGESRPPDNAESRATDRKVPEIG